MQSCKLLCEDPEEAEDLQQCIQNAKDQSLYCHVLGRFTPVFVFL
jgi:hypothetical protein